MKWLFWISVAAVAYAYVGYPLVLWVQARLHSRHIAKSPITPTISIVISVHNEAARLPSKLRNLAALDYPRERCQVVVASDGSTDGTNELLAGNHSVRSAICPVNRGKAAALNAALAVATGEIVVFTDVRQEIEISAVRELVANFADSTVGCVSGELMLRSPGSDNRENGVSMYWRLEKLIRKLEAATGSVVGATGAIYAVRRSLVPVLPEGTLLDDVYIPLAVARQQYRVVFEPAARAWDDAAAAGEQEFRRKVRTLAGNYQLLQIAPWLLSSSNRLRFRFLSHKLARLAVPFLLVSIFLSSVALWGNEFYRLVVALQAIFYLLAIIGLWTQTSSCFTAVPASFCLLNAAAAAALFSFLRYRNSPMLLWKKDALSLDNSAEVLAGRDRPCLTAERVEDAAAVCAARGADRMTGEAR